MEGAGLGSRVVIGQHDRGIESIDSLGIADSKLLQATGAVRSQLPEIVIEGTILLQHEEDVLDRTRTGGSYRYSRRLLDRVVSVHPGCCRVGRGNRGVHHR